MDEREQTRRATVASCDVNFWYEGEIDLIQSCEFSHVYASETALGLLTNELRVQQHIIKFVGLKKNSNPLTSVRVELWNS